ncbi:hypothetical protein ANACOL_01740 [Anaerotruncus colihominis DSM 17241]|uniref:Uncharacterized protein n=1 Tax=Anaerotruncus colihominis DSM 17241 TaxID=445972 RepID=B0PAE2_9FIRM|nr:hypothetical protein ANACOL_01740 [Anaerotruncus colihominis DSM 17241]
MYGQANFLSESIIFGVFLFTRSAKNDILYKDGRLALRFAAPPPKI